MYDDEDGVDDDFHSHYDKNTDQDDTDDYNHGDHYNDFLDDKFFEPQIPRTIFFPVHDTGKK